MEMRGHFISRDRNRLDRVEARKTRRLEALRPRARSGGGCGSPGDERAQPEYKQAHPEQRKPAATRDNGGMQRHTATAPPNDRKMKPIRSVL